MCVDDLAMTIHPHQPVGATITDFELRNVSAGDSARLQELMATFGALVFRDQHLSDSEFVDFMRKLGPLTFTVGETPVPGHPELNVVSNIGRTTPPKSSFHTDSTYFTKPPAYTALRAVTIPESGGETLFTNQYNSYETLAEELREQLNNQTFRHEVTGVDLDGIDDAETAADHPIFFQHPISNRTALYMSTPQRCTQVSGMCKESSRLHIQACYDHSIQEHNIYRHVWKPGDIVVWDNGCTLHRADHSQVSGDRVLHRALSLGYNA